MKVLYCDRHRSLSNDNTCCKPEGGACLHYGRCEIGLAWLIKDTLTDVDREQIRLLLSEVTA